MKFFVGLSIALIVILKLGDISMLQAPQFQRPKTLFSLQPHSTDSQTTLWESSLFEVNGMESQIRWQIHGDHITAAKACTKEGFTVIAQVTMNLKRRPKTPLISSVPMQGTQICEIQLVPESLDNPFHIEDEDLMFSGENQDGSQELSIFKNELETTDAVFRKI